MEPPKLRTMGRGGVEEEAGGIPTFLIVLSLGSCLGLICIGISCHFIVRRIKQIRARRRAKAAESPRGNSKDDDEDAAQDLGLGIAIPGVSRKRGEGRDKKRPTMHIRHSQTEIKSSMMLGGLGPKKQEEDKGPPPEEEEEKRGGF